ncbi:MAG: hypothetical protein HC844_07175 [Tabrizicola sp.]|nr:hypothetical protein [Tabrizicola sp.]
MTVFILLVALLVLAGAAFALCRVRALRLSQGRIGVLHSLPGYYGWHGAIMVLLPGLVALTLWLVIQPMVIEARVSAYLPPELTTDATARKLAMADVRRLADGIDAALAAGKLRLDADGALQAEAGLSMRDALAQAGCGAGAGCLARSAGGRHRLSRAGCDGFCRARDRRASRGAPRFCLCRPCDRA